ncbi:hypothetical protein LX36DRAFT_669933 [Colletotrichum falcatum]|nr:hypothetical protein LX36DRAFT_669933 [Colletotrichum falcatum]
MSSAYIPPTVEEGPREDKSERGDQKGKEDLDYEVERAKQESAHQKASEKASLGAKTRQKNAPSAANAQRGKPPSNPHIHDGAEKSDASIRFKDAVGRKFTFPYELVKTWSGMEGVIKEAFVHVDLIGPYVQQGRYDIIGPDACGQWMNCHLRK